LPGCPDPAFKGKLPVNPINFTVLFIAEIVRRKESSESRTNPGS
jgi:hypothetical protein